MQYSLTLHKNYNKVFFYSLNTYVCIAKDVELTGAMLSKLEAALKAKAKV